MAWSLWLIATGWPCSPGTAVLLDEALDEGQRIIRDLAPAAVDRERVPTIADLDDLGHAVVAAPPPERGVRDGPGTV